MKKGLMILLLLTLFNLSKSEAQVIGPVSDPVHTSTTGVLAVLTEVGNFIREHGVEILEWTQKALQVINAVVANYELIQKTEAVFEDIFQLYFYLYGLIGDHPNIEDKVKHILVLEEIIVKGIEELDIFSTIFQEGGLVMDDRGRIKLLKEAYLNAKKYRRVLRHFRINITRDIFSKGLSRQSREVYNTLFEYN